jgi:acetyltransferase-like isoleucine patch superfamily enzyme
VCTELLPFEQERMETPSYIHPLAVVEESAFVDSGTKVWHFAHIRTGVTIGKECVIGKNVFIDTGVVVGSRVKIQNNASLYAGVTLEDGVFIGPHVCFTNDLLPRAINPDGSLRSAADWIVTHTTIGFGASIGANSTIVAGANIGRWCLIGAGSVVTGPLPPHALAYGTPARVQGVVAPSGEIVSRAYAPGKYRCNDGSFVTIEAA